MNRKLAKVDYLVFGAHPDDVELSCAGTVAKLVREGKKVGLVDLTRGEMGTRGTAEEREKEAAAAGAILGASFRLHLSFADGGLERGRDQELELIRIIRRTRPAVVIAPIMDERHPDHSRAGEVITDASFYAGLAKLETGEKAHRPQAVVYYLMNYPVIPSFVVDVTSTWAAKMRAIRAFKSQFYNPRSKEPQTSIAKKSFLDLMEARGRYFGALIGAEYGEAFLTKMPPRVDDIAAAYHGREVS